MPAKKLTKEEVDKLKEEQKNEIYEIEGETDEGEELVFYFKKPNRPTLSRFAKEAMTDALRAMNNLVFACLLSPSADEVKTLFAEKPGLPISVGGELQKIVGTNQNFLSRRL